MYAIDVDLQQNGKMNGCNYDVRTETRLYDMPWLSANACARITATESTTKSTDATTSSVPRYVLSTKLCPHACKARPVLLRVKNCEEDSPGKELGLLCN